MNPTAEPTRFVILLKRSEAFEAAVVACFLETGFVLASADQKHGLVATAGTLCVEHTGAVRAAFSAAAPNSGAAVLRLQCEAPLRATWLVHSATPVHMGKLGRTLDLEADQAARHLPGYLEILEAVVRKAPQGLSTLIAEFNQYSRHALNSLVHIGIHPMRRVQEGFPLETAATVVRFSNALMHLAYRILASLRRPPCREPIGAGA